ncbi:hypothetical protein JOM56_009785 [Amanita muscaria]
MLRLFILAGNVRAVVDVIHTKLNSAVPRDVHDTVHDVPTVDSIPGNVNSIAARAGDDDIDVIPRAGDDDTLDHVPTVHAIPGNVDSVVPRDGDEPPCDGKVNGSGNGEDTQ